MLAVVAACGTEGGESTTTVGDDVVSTTVDTGQVGPTTTATAAGDDGTTTTAAGVAGGVDVSDTDLGQVLVDPDGFTVYIFTNDGQGPSTCYDACAELWPPVPGDTAISPSLDQSIFGTTTRDDGSEQLTVDGRPLYRYTPDTSPGETTGQGVGGVWFVVNPDGDVIEAATDDDVLIDYGY
jgi:predicted lipoprotein with Yx(FWY)xxD motif